MLGYVTKFDKLTRRGMIYCNNNDGKISLCSFSLHAGESVNVGDYVSFPQGKENGAPQAVLVKIPAKVERPKSTAPEMEKRPAPIFSKPIFSTNLQKTTSIPAVDVADRDLCNACNKRMIPQLVISQGKPERSFCPFCGTTHRDFRQPEQPTILHECKRVTADAIITGVIGAIVMAAIGL